MARVIKAVQSAKPGLGSATEIPDEVKEEIEGLYKHLTEHPDQEGFAEFSDPDPEVVKDEVKAWLKQARTYCTTREAGALKFRQLPSKHLQAGQVRFSITADLPANGAREGQASVQS